jgi:excisionase family DNA binding protein
VEIEWLTATEAAQHLKVRPRTLLLWAREGKILAHKLSGIHRRIYRFLRHELDRMTSVRSTLKRIGQPQDGRLSRDVAKEVSQETARQILDGRRVSRRLLSHVEIAVSESVWLGAGTFGNKSHRPSKTTIPRLVRNAPKTTND